MHSKITILVSAIGALVLVAGQATATTLLTEDFSSGIPAAWVSPVPSAWNVVSGAAYQSQSVPNVRYELVYTSGTAWTDYQVQVDMWSSAWYHCCSGISLYFRYLNGSNYYRFSAQDDGYLYVWKNVGGVFTNINKVYVGFSSINQRNTYAISVTGSTIKVYMNSNLMSTFSDSSLTSGTIALSSDNIPGYFDNVLVQTTATSVQHPGEVLVTGGTLAGQSLSASNWQITVAPGAQINGTVQLSTNNKMGSSAVAPLGYTWTWGDRITSAGSVNSSIPTGQQTWSVTFNQTAPSTPGTYYILFGFNGEYNLQQVFSCTNWTNTTVVWNDGNDYFDMNATKLSAAQTVGYVAGWQYLYPDGFHSQDVPVAPIKVVVSQLPSPGCSASETVLCLQGGRFSLSVAWSNPYGGNTGVGHAIVGTNQSGFFWFFDPTNIELVVKILDGTSQNGHFWVLYGALSDVEYWITVTDTATGSVRAYHNPPYNICGKVDVNAF